MPEATLDAKPDAHPLIEKLRANTRFPTLGLTVTRILNLAQSADGSIAELSNLILADVYLTQRVLGLANAALYRRSLSSPVTTISRAIVLLGFEQVRLLALGVLLIDKVADSAQADALRTELQVAACASIAARELADRFLERSREEASIAALLANVGRLMVAVLDFDSYRKVRERGARADDGDAGASAAVLGTSYRNLTTTLLESWGIPGPLIAATEAVCSPMSSARGEPTLGQLVDCSVRLGAALEEPDPERRRHALESVSRVYEKTLGLAPGRVTELAATMSERMAPLRRALGVRDVSPSPADEPASGPAIAGRQAVAQEVPPAAAAGRAAGSPSRRAGEAQGDARVAEPPARPGTAAQAMQPPDELPPPEAAIVSPATPGAAAPGAQPRVLAGIQRVASELAEGRALGVVLASALEAMHEAFGFNRSLLFLRDPARPLMSARLWTGAIDAAQARACTLAAEAPGDLISVATLRGVDMQLRDTSEPRIAARMPDWFYRTTPRARSLVLLPILYQSRPIGALYGDRAEAGAPSLGADDLELLKTLKSQIVLALRTIRT